MEAGWYKGTFSLMHRDIDAAGARYAAMIPQQVLQPQLHITMASAREVKSGTTESPTGQVKQHLPLPTELFDDVLFFGLGHQACAATGNECWYIVAHSAKVQAWRAAHDLGPKDLHVTLHVRGGDVHNVVKDASTLVNASEANFGAMAQAMQGADLQAPSTQAMRDVLLQNGYLDGEYWAQRCRVKQRLTSAQDAYATLQALADSCTVAHAATAPPLCKLLNGGNYLLPGWREPGRRAAHYWPTESTGATESGMASQVLPHNFARLPLGDRVLFGSGLPKQKHMAALADMGVRTIVTLMETPAHLQHNEVEVVHFAVRDRHPPTLDQMRAILSHVQGTMAQGHAVLIHCLGGVGRTATALAACYMAMMSSNDTVVGKDEALQAVKANGRKVMLTVPQLDFLRSDWYRECCQQGHGHGLSTSNKLPRVVLLVGLPASGKSTLAAALANAMPNVHVVCQDEVGLKACEEAAGALCKHAGHTVIVDRCNLTRADRAAWRTLCHGLPTMCIHLMSSAEECKERIVERKHHPGVAHGTGASIVERQAKQLQCPTEDEGFEGGLVRLEDFDAVAAFLQARYGIAPQAAEPDPDRPIKFPRTKHAVNLGGAGRDDLMLTKAEVEELLRHPLIVEEKVDGANMGIRLTADGALVVQNRSHFVTAASHPQFGPLAAWLAEHEDALRRVLVDHRTVLYGEWLVATHSIHYSRLPDWFLAYDLLDTRTGHFLCRSALEDRLRDSGLHMTPRVFAQPQVFASVAELQALTQVASQFYDGPVEGVVLRHCDDTRVVSRAKVVRSNFIAGNEHWTRQGDKMQKNVRQWQ